MRTYKDFQKWNIGSSDIASLLLLGSNENGAEPMLLAFGSDGDYSAYIIPDNVENRRALQESRLNILTGLRYMTIVAL